MKLNKAIEIVTSFLDGTYDHRDQDLEDAFKLVIEAAKRIRQHRKSGAGWNPALLPGETKE